MKRAIGMVVLVAAFLAAADAPSPVGRWRIAAFGGEAVDWSFAGDAITLKAPAQNWVQTFKVALKPDGTMRADFGRGQLTFRRMD